MTASLRLSVVIPTHNRSRLLQRAVRSSLGQGCEVIVIDDGSSDDTIRVLHELEHPDLRWRRLAESGGPARARNAAASLITGDITLYLDDDDYLLPGAADRIRATAQSHPDSFVWFHNCRRRSGATSIPVDLPPSRCTYEQWLDGVYAGELKPVVSREFHEQFAFPDTGAGGEGILWGRVIRERDAVVSGDPVVMYDDRAGAERLTSAVGLLRRAPQNASIAEAVLEEFGEDLRARDERRWARRVLAAATYNLLAGRRARARELLRSMPATALGPAARLILPIALRLPLPWVRLLYLAQRRELVSTTRQRALRRALWPPPVDGPEARTKR